jgi:hypothetical protein
VLYGIGGDLHAVRINGDSPLVLPLTREPDRPARPTSFTPDGTRLIVAQLNRETGTDLLVIPVERDSNALRLGPAEVLLQTPAEEDGGTFSPDGKWFAYHSNESGLNEVYVRSVNDKGAKWQVSSRGGLFPKWSSTKMELFFRTPDGRPIVARYNVHDGTFVPETPRFFSEHHVLAENFLSPNFEVARDGQRLVVVLPTNTSTVASHSKPIHVLVHFVEQLRGRENQ